MVRSYCIKRWPLFKTQEYGSESICGRFFFLTKTFRGDKILDCDNVNLAGSEVPWDGWEPRRAENQFKLAVTIEVASGLGRKVTDALIRDQPKQNCSILLPFFQIFSFSLVRFYLNSTFFPVRPFTSTSMIPHEVNTVESRPHLKPIKTWSKAVQIYLGST